MWQPLVLYRSGKATGMNRILGLKLHGLPSTIFAGAICIFYTVRREGTEFSTPICPSEYEVCTWSSSLNFEGYDHTINFEGICSTTTRMSSHEFPAMRTRRGSVSFVLVSTYDYTCPWFSPNFMTHLSSINFNKLLHQIGTYNPISAIKLLTNQVILIIQYLNQTLSLKSSGFQWPPHFYIPGSQRDLTPSCLATSNELSPRNVAQSSRVLVADGT